MSANNNLFTDFKVSFTRQHLNLPGKNPMQRKWRSSLFLLSFIAPILASTGCARSSAPQGHFQETPVVADGNTGDWTLPLRFSDASYSFQYSITNDNRNFYICVFTKDD